MSSIPALAAIAIGFGVLPVIVCVFVAATRDAEALERLDLSSRSRRLTALRASVAGLAQAMIVTIIKAWAGQPLAVWLIAATLFGGATVYASRCLQRAAPIIS